jgi:hypothetical protein
MKIIEKFRRGSPRLERNLLGCMRYHRDFVPITWRDCDLRNWLNGTFYDNAFTLEKKDRIFLHRMEDPQPLG